MNTSIIKIGTILLFASLMSFYIAHQSGCGNILGKGNALEHRGEMIGDTIKIMNTDSFAVTHTKIFPGSKMMQIFTKNDIAFFIHKDSLTEKAKEGKFEYSYKHVRDTISIIGEEIIIPSSKSAPIFEEQD